ncbi:diaminopimelate decarboxylase [Gammaproteobacteria bacterium]|jgi:diaminopimelate decarboxylase|nr:diaminopimelate decarboxylase [Gammaproteobacteria bacterium]MDC1189732.1 diaminopimelate decarboxylase [Gammaproteobacteria bacterium]
MDFFNYKDGKLFCEGVDLSLISKTFDTPAYVYSKKTLERHVDAYVESFTSSNNLVCFAVKSLSNISILKILKDKGCGFDIVSGGELHRVILAGADPKKIIFSGVGKSKSEIALGIKNDVLSFNIESSSELYRIEKVAKDLGKIAPVSIRFNPDVDSGGHDYITTGRKGDKFGISSIEDILNLSEHISNSDSLKIVGVACHIGSQILGLDSYKAAARKTIELADKLLDLGIELDFLDLGGGLGVPYNGETPPSPNELVACLENELSERKERIIIEPGRSISANAGILLTKVEYIKDEFLIVDAAMNDLLRPALYKAEHDVWNLDKNNSQETKVWNIVGPICESSDFLARDISIPAKEEDVLAIKSAGAYGFVMSSNYNSRPRCPEILVDEDKFKLIRKRENLDDLVRSEINPDD